MPGVELQTPAADDVERLQHQSVFHVRVVDELLHRRIKHLHVLIYAQPDAGGVNTDIGDVILLRQGFNGVGLRAEVHAAPLMTLKDAELAARHGGRCNHHAPGAVAVLRALRQVVTDPHFAPAEGPQRQRFEICPHLPAVHHALLQQLQRETVYNTATREPVEITQPGDYPKATAPLKPATVFDVWSGKAWKTDTKAQREAAGSDAEAKKAALIAEANNVTQAWQTQLLLSIITDCDKAMLTKWVQYIQAVQATDISAAPNIVWPVLP